MPKNQEKTVVVTTKTSIRKDDFRKIIPFPIFLDKSGSMAHLRSEVYEAVRSLLTTLKEANETNVDFHYVVRLMTFNEYVSECTDEAFLEPEDVLVMFDEGDYKCFGGTGFDPMYSKVNQVYSTQEGGIYSGIFKRYTTPVSLFITDMMATDHKDALENARNSLHSNKYFASSKRIVIFTGKNENERQEAVRLAGGEDYVITVTTDISGVLSSILQQTCMAVSNSTNIRNIDTTPHQVGEDIKKKLSAGERSAIVLTPEEIRKKLEKMANEP